MIKIANLSNENRKSLFQNTAAKMQVASLINESLEEVAKGVEPIDGIEFFDRMKEKYRKHNNID